MLPNQFAKLLLVYLSFALFPSNTYAQNLDADSLLKTINPNNPDSVNGQIYYDLARNGYANNTKKSITWAQGGTKYFKKSGHTALMTQCMNIEAVCLLILDKHEESIKLHYEILKIREAHKDTLGMAESLLNIGNVYYRGNDKDEAIRFYTQSRTYALKNKNIKLLSSLENNLGTYYKDRYFDTKDNTDKLLAIKHLREAIRYKNQLPTDRTLAKAYISLANVYYLANDKDLSLEYANLAEKLALRNKNDEAVASSKVLLSKIAIEIKDIEKAQNKLDELYTYIAENKAFHILNSQNEDITGIRDNIRNLRSNSSAILDSTYENNYNSLLLSRQKVREELRIKYETEKKNWRMPT